MMFWRRVVRTKFDVYVVTIFKGHIPIYVVIIFKGHIPRRFYTVYYTFPVYMLQ